MVKKGRGGFILRDQETYVARQKVNRGKSTMEEVGETANGAPGLNGKKKTGACQKAVEKRG